MTPTHSWNANVFVFFPNEKNAEQAKKSMEVENDVSFERSKTALVQDGPTLKCEIAASDYSVFKSRVHGTLKSAALIQRLQSLPKN